MRLASLLVLTDLASACVLDDAHGELTVVNSSDATIVELYVTDVDSPTWGANLLGDVALPRDETIEVDVQCNTYDSRVVDDTGSDCRLASIRLCADDATWVIADATCNVF